MDYETAIKYLSGILKFGDKDPEEFLVSKAKEILYNCGLPINDKTVKISIISLAEWYKMNLIFTN